VSSEPIDPLTLMAYADGALPPDEAARVARRIETDAAARAQVAQYRRSAALARAALDADLAQPVPAALQRGVEQAIAQARRKAVPAPAQADAMTAPRWRRALAALGLDLQPRLALAAGVVALATGAAGYLAGRMATVAEPQIATDRPGVQVAAAHEWAALARALDAAPSGSRQALPGGGQVELVASLRSGAGALCREFKVERANVASVTALACRDARQWSVRFALATAAAGGYTPAGGAGAAMDAYLAAIGSGAPLSREDEARALATLR
jgi:anti-sigma factor RsiW